MTDERPQHLTPRIQMAYAQLSPCPREGLQCSIPRNHNSGSLQSYSVRDLPAR